MHLKKALKALDSDRLITYNQLMDIQRALNLTLTNHNEKQIKTQEIFYSALKKKGYQGISDYNDRLYSSYKANDPIIIFDMDSVKLDSVSNMNDKITKKTSERYERARLSNDIKTRTVDRIKDFLEESSKNAEDHVYRKVYENTQK